MINSNEEYVLGIALANENLASEIAARVISATPANGAAAQAILDIIDNNEAEAKQIREYLIVATCSRSVGNEIADQLEIIIECLEWQAADLAANNAALNAAQARLSSLSSQAREYLVVAMANRAIASSVADKIDAAIAAAAAIPDSIVI